ncbi:MAG TPA: ABC transporter permease [Methylomirabilota bacterium]|jgi:putative spermidine/putrescine transport system permease protein|nr:ABC transporter permease [Methylomirabilota bacterium]
MSRRARLLLAAVNGAIYAFLLAPILVVVVVSFGDSAFLQFPPRRLSLRWYTDLGEYPDFVQSFWLSLGLAAATAAVAGVVGTLGAFALVRHRFPGRRLLGALVMAPVALPGLVTGIALLQFFSLLRTEPSIARLLAGHVAVTVPYVVRSVAAALAGVDRTLEDAARGLGASPWTATRLVTLPLVKPGLVAGAVFSFILSFDNVAVSLFLTTPRLVPLPIQIYNYVESSARPIIASISTLQVAIVVMLLAIAERVVGFSRRYVGGVEP